MPNTRTALIGYVEGLSRVEAQLDPGAGRLTQALGGPGRRWPSCSPPCRRRRPASATPTTPAWPSSPTDRPSAAWPARRSVLTVVQQLLAAYAAQLDYLAQEAE